MKKPKIFTTILLSLLLIVGLLCTGVFFAASQLFQKENVTSLLNGVSTGEKILQYEHLPEDTEQSNIYDRLAREVPLQVALVVGISEKDAEICQNGAFAYLKSRQLDKQAYTTFDSIAEELGIGYTQTAVADNIINPNEIVTYMNVLRERVRIKKEPLLLETITTKYKTVLDQLKNDGFFCSLDIDQKNPFAYLMLTGRDADVMKNGLYQVMENKVGEIFNERLLNYIDRLKGDSQADATIAQQTLNETLLKEVYAYIHDSGYSEEKLNLDKANATLISSITNYISPKLFDCLPSYDDTVSSVPSIALSLIRTTLQGKLTYIGIGVCAVLALLILLAGKKIALVFLSLALLLSGGASFFSKTYSLKVSDFLMNAMNGSGNPLSFLVPDFVASFMNRFSTLGIYLGAAGLVLLIASIIFRSKRTAE